MKKISIELRCRNCGRTFTHSKTVSGDGNSYKFWALNNVTLCPGCYAEDKRRSRAEWATGYLYDNGITLPSLTGTDNQVRYAESLRENFIDRYCYEIADVIGKYNACHNSLWTEAHKKGIETGQEALQRWEGTRDYYLFASVYIKSASFLISLLSDRGIERVA